MALNIMYTLCLFTQLFFMIFEIIRFKKLGVQYAKDFWNLITMCQFPIFTLIYIKKMISQFESDAILEFFVESAILFLAFYKCFYYLRIYDGFCHIITMIIVVIKEIMPFTFIVVSILFGLAKIFQTLHVGINDPDNEYSQIKMRYWMIWLQTYKNSVTDVIAPTVDQEIHHRLAENPYLTYSVYGFITSMWVF